MSQAPSTMPPSAAVVEAANLLQAVPSGRRAAVVSEALQFLPEVCAERAFAVGPLRAGLASCWEELTRQPVPIQALRAELTPPVQIGTSLLLGRLNVNDSAEAIGAVIVDLLGHLRRRIAKRPNESQQWLFEPSESSTMASSDANWVGGEVTNLCELVSAGCSFRSVYADPPWPYENTASRAAAENHYATMSVRAICDEPVKQLAATDAHLHLWTTNAFLREAFDVIAAWGFEFKSCLVWVKPEIGMGNYWRVSHEFLLLGVRGDLTFRDRTKRSWIEAHRTAHSRKPGIIREFIEQVSPGPYLELYGREELPNSSWTVYGNQVERRFF